MSPKTALKVGILRKVQSFWMGFGALFVRMRVRL
jgi:hypothetical protein